MIFSPGATRSGFRRPSPVGPFRGEIRDAVHVRHVAMRGADGDREVGVARVVDGERHPRAGRADRRLQRAVAGVAGGDDHHDAALHEPVDLDAERALAARKPLGLEIVAEAHVHAVDEQPAAVAVHLLDVRDGGDEVAHGAFAVLVEHAQAHQLALRRHAADAVQPRLLVLDVLGVLFKYRETAMGRLFSGVSGGTRHSPAMIPATCVPWPFSSSNGPVPSTVKSLCKRRGRVDVGVSLKCA